MTKSLENSLGIHIQPSRSMYQKPYPSSVDARDNPMGWKVPDFQKFSGTDSKTTMEHISMYLAQLGGASKEEFMKLRNFPLSLTGTAFSWFTSLPPCSINSWAQLEEKFHAYFYNGVQETRLSHLTSVRQGRDETVLDFFKRFREIKSRCFHLEISERDLIDFCFAGLRSSIRDKLEFCQFSTCNQLLERAISVESRLKESHDNYKSHRTNVHAVDDYSSSDDESKEVMAAEIRWPAENKQLALLSNRFIKIGVRK